MYTTIRQLYLPVQPTIKQADKDVVYREIAPVDVLYPFIYCYWELKTANRLSDQFTYRVVADGCIDIFFELNNPKESYVMGFCRKYTEFQLEHSFHYIGIRFLPTMFPQIFKVNALELSNYFQYLEAVAPEIASFINSRAGTESDLEQLGAAFNNYFLKKLDTIKFKEDTRLYEAIAIILKNQGVLNIETQLDTGISSRQLRRLFEYYIGDTAKTFSKVVRFQNILRAKPSGQSLRQNKLFFDAGYYDQAHFIKEFRNFYGTTPGKAFGR